MSRRFDAYYDDAYCGRRSASSVSSCSPCDAPSRRSSLPRRVACLEQRVDDHDFDICDLRDDADHLVNQSIRHDGMLQNHEWRLRKLERRVRHYL